MALPQRRRPERGRMAFAGDGAVLSGTDGLAHGGVALREERGRVGGARVAVATRRVGSGGGLPADGNIGVDTGGRARGMRLQ